VTKLDFGNILGDFSYVNSSGHPDAPEIRVNGQKDKSGARLQKKFKIFFFIFSLFPVFYDQQ
jgi:hypothetical protein